METPLTGSNRLQVLLNKQRRASHSRRIRPKPSDLDKFPMIGVNPGRRGQLKETACHNQHTRLVDAEIRPERTTTTVESNERRDKSKNGEPEALLSAYRRDGVEIRVVLTARRRFKEKLRLFACLQRESESDDRPEIEYSFSAID